MKAIIYTAIGLAVAIGGIVTATLYLPSPCDDQCMIAGLQAEMDSQCYDYRGTNQLCVEHYNNLLAEISTKGD